jgi:hypothetical protein
LEKAIPTSDSQPTTYDFCTIDYIAAHANRGAAVCHFDKVSTAEQL